MVNLLRYRNTRIVIIIIIIIIFYNKFRLEATFLQEQTKILPI